MPLIGEFHTKYWEFSDTSVTPKVISRPGYSGWQASVISGGFGGFQVAYERGQWWIRLWRRIKALLPGQRAQLLDALGKVEQGESFIPPPIVVTKVVQVPAPPKRVPVIKPSAVRGWWEIGRRVDRLPADRAAVLRGTLDLLESDAFPVAKRAVRETAKTLGFNRPEAWKPYSQMLKSDPGRAENVFRHQRAADLTTQRLGSTLTNPQTELLVELAYHAYAVQPKD